MALAALLAVVGNFEANAIGVSEESCPIVGSVLGVELCLRGFNAYRTKLIGNRHNISDRLNAKAKVMKPRSVGVVLLGIAGWTKNVAEMTIEVLDVRIAAQGEIVLSETKRFKQDVIVEGLRALKIRHCDVDMVDSNNFGHGAKM